MWRAAGDVAGLGKKALSERMGYPYLALFIRSGSRFELGAQVGFGHIAVGASFAYAVDYGFYYPGTTAGTTASPLCTWTDTLWTTGRFL